MTELQSPAISVIASSSGGPFPTHGEQVFTVTLAGGSGDRRAWLTDLDHTVGAEERFVYFVEPAWSAERANPGPPLEDWQRYGYSATGIAVDLEFEDGAFLSDTGAVDQYGHPLSAWGQGASRWLRTDQSNRVVVDLAALVGRRAVAAHVRIVGAPGQDISARVVVHGFETTTEVIRSSVDLVDTRRGSRSIPLMSRGNTYPCAAVPNASAFAAPVTNRHEDGWIYDFAVDPPSLDAFTITRLPSPWIGDHGSLQLFPATRGKSGEIGWNTLEFARERESAQAHSYAVEFDNGISVRLAAASRAMVMHVDFAGADPVMAIGPTNGRGSVEIDSAARNRVRIHSDHVSVNVREAPRTYYHLLASADIAESWVDRDGLSFFRFHDPGDTGLTLKIGYSYLGPDRAQINMDTELGASTFHEVEQQARRAWEALLGRVTVTGASRSQRETFFSCLYRVFLFPNVAFDEVDGRPRHVLRFSAPDGRFAEPEDAAGVLSIGGGFWDTYRTTWPAYFLFAPSRAAELLDGFVQHYVDRGWIPRWSGPGPIDCMVGTSSDAVFADAYVKHVGLTLRHEAYAAAIKNATVSADSPLVGRKGLDRSLFRGFTTTAINEGLSWSMEGAICDAALAEWSRRLADSEPEGSTTREDFAANALYFHHRSLSYRNLFDSDRGFFIGRDEAGAFRSDADFDPAAWGGDYAETNAWGMAHTAPHDGDGLAALYGSREALGESLDAVFATIPPPVETTLGAYPSVIHEMVEARDVRMGMWAPSNQPAHHTPFMYLFSDRPHRCQEIVRSAVRRLFVGGDNGQGYPGDEDNGEMSAWYIFLSMGLYPLAMGTGLYAITSPSFETISIDLENGKVLTVTTRNQSPSNDYIQSVTVNGESWEDAFISHDLLVDGCIIDIELGPSPSSWGRLPDEVSSDAPLIDMTSRGVVSSSGLGDAAIVTDDDSRNECSAEPGWWFASETGGEAVVMYALTSGAHRAGPTSWRLQGSDDAQVWTDLDVRDGENFEWSRMTRPFRVRTPHPFLHVRVLIEGEACSLAQVEFFGRCERLL